ncbi:MAG: tetratricopeptide repeat protein [Acidiferrobacterales bacterium]
MFAMFVLVALLAPGIAQAAFKKEDAEVKALIAAGKYQSAAKFINGHPDLMAQPQFVRLFTHLLTTQYVYSVNFSIFALKDLKKGERVEDFRGKPGRYQLVGGPLDELLYKQIRKNPDSPDLNYAVGEYLSRGEACGCRAAGPLKDLSGDDGTYFLKAYQAGVADGWSLFRIGMHQQMQGRLDDAITFYKKSLAREPGNIDATYNLAAVYYMKHDYGAARGYADKSVGKYRNVDLNADSYALQGMILAGLGNNAAAESSLEQALHLKSWHVQAFTALLALYRRTGQNDKYVQLAQHFIALDYANTYTFGAYIDYLKGAGETALDRKVERSLLALSLPDAQQIAAVYFGLGRMADMRNDKAEAVRRYQRSLAALKSLRKPPQGAIPAITQRIAELNAPPGK